MGKTNKVKLTSMEIVEQKREALKKLFPEVFSEGHIDFEQLKSVLGEWIDLSKERFGLNWPGKAGCMRIIQQPSVATLKPARDESVNFDETENLFIEGDNLEVLKLLQKAYFGKIKMIYIDPPYNTGKEFIYPDKYSETLNTYLAYTGQIDAGGHKFSTNTDTTGRYHSNWLNMMYPRLYLARNLLREDGVIFISIDDNEAKNLRSLCDEIFGEENFVEAITWNKRIPKNDKGIGNIHEYVLIYVVNSSIRHEFHMPKEGLEEIYNLLAKLKRKAVPLAEAEREVRKLYLKKGYDRGITLYNALDKNYRLWGKINVSWPNAETFGPRYDILHPKKGVPVNVPDRGWRWIKETFDSLLDYENCEQLHDGTFRCGNIWFDKDENTQPSSIKYLDETEGLLLRSIISRKSDGGVEVAKLFGTKNIMSYPKPTSLLKLLLSSISQPDDIIMDFFSGSCTTAHSVLDLNKEDGGNRKFIMVQLPEPCDEKKEAFKAGYKTVADIGKERIRRTAKKIEAEQNDQLDRSGNSKLDLGFKVFKLAPSNFKAWQGDAETLEELEQQLFSHINHIGSSSTPEDVLYELLLKSGFPLTTKVRKIQMAGKEVFSIEEDSMLICLDKSLNGEVIDAMAEIKPRQVICLDEGFQGNDQLKANAVQTFISRTQEEEGEIIFKTV